MKKSGRETEKANVMRLLEQAGVEYKSYNYEGTGIISGADVAAYLGQDPDRCFKTLVTAGKSGEHYVFAVPVSGELDLKKAAAASGEKNIEMIMIISLLKKVKKKYP